MKILAVADKVVELIYGPNIRKYFGDVDLVISCGDLPYDYLEYIVTMLNVPLYYVHGNHDREAEYTMEGMVPAAPGGCVNLDGRLVRYKGLTLAGLEGSMRYRPGPFQYSDLQMRLRAAYMAPKLWFNRLRTGRYLDILVTHAPPCGIHDQPDLCHRGFRSLLGFLDRYQPRYLIHGHIHLYGHNQTWRTLYRETVVLNAFGYRLVDIDVATGDR